MNEPDEPEVKEAFVRCAELGLALGVTSINKLPGCWEHQVDERWWIAMNGHRENIKASDGFEVPPFNIAIKYNGWPAGIIGAHGGIIAAGSCANEDAFIEALLAATAAAKEPR